MERAPFLLQRRPQQQRDGRGTSCWSPGTYHTDDTFQLRADDTALRSTLLVSAFGPSYWSSGTHHTDDTFRVRADDTALRSTFLVSALGRISSPPAGNIDHAAAELPKSHPSDLFAPRSASVLHSTSPRVATTSPKIGRRPVLFLRFGTVGDALYATIHGYAGTNNTTFCVGTAAIVRHSALLST